MTPSERITEAIAANPKCTTGLLSKPGVFEIGAGPSGGPEMLALVFADERHLGYWYGHVRRHPSEPNGAFVALVAFLKVYVNAPTVPLLFQRFNYWTRIRLEYEPCTVNGPFDGFAVEASYEGAVRALARMIARFDIDKRLPDEESTFYRNPVEMRIFDIFPFHQDIEMKNTPIPMPFSLMIAKNDP